MRFNDLIGKNTKPRPLTYMEQLNVKLEQELTVKPPPKFTALEWAIMEGGGSLELPTRTLPDGSSVSETVFGNPKV